MTRQSMRNPEGGLIDRTKPLSFTFDGRRYEGYAGDTLASALLANGVSLVGRSFKYHRPRGVSGIGVEEPNALVQLETGARTQPNLRATEVELYDGLACESQNRWPSLEFDVGAVNNMASALIPSGFYYKTFMWPAKLWMTYEKVIRNAAGLGKSPTEPDVDRYENRYAHCDVLVAGGGPAGLMAAVAAARAGARVIVATDNAEWGGQLTGRRDQIDGKPAGAWVADVVAELSAMPDVTLLNRASVSSYYDQNMLLIRENLTDHLGDAPEFMARQRIWQVRAREVVLATGAIERPLVFADNDRPGVMLASAAQAYTNRFGVRVGDRAVIFTNNDGGYVAALDLAQAGVTIMAVVDVRPEADGELLDKLKRARIGALLNHAVVGVEGTKKVSAARVMALDPRDLSAVGRVREIQCDTIAVSGGWNPTVHLFSQSGGKLRFDETTTTFLPDRWTQKLHSAGACNGAFELTDCLAEGARAGLEAARAAGFAEASEITAPQAGSDTAMRPMALWRVPDEPGHHGKAFVDTQNDVTANDVALAHREGYISVEHLKRYTTLGMGTDQGRTSNVNGLALMAGHRGEAIPAVGTTTFRPPFTALAMGAITAEETGRHFAATRRSAMHDWHERAGAPFVPAGQWLRPQAYLRPGETIMDAAYRETTAVRSHVGICDVSTLGKIDIQGRDAAEFLNRLYINGFAKLPVGKVRYGVMLREDGLVFDDGTTTRLSENRYLMTTTTANAGGVMQHMEYHAQVVWPELDVHVVSVTEEWAAIAVAGPDSRRLLECLTSDIDVSNDACPFMAYREGTIAGAPARLFRISFSGELAYEIAVPADYGSAVWQSLMETGEEFGITPYGMEALGILRLEKGHVVGGELNGRTSADDLGFGGMASKTKDYIGRRGAGREALSQPDRLQLVGLTPVDAKSRIPRGAQLVKDPSGAPPFDMEGEVTSNGWSPNLGHYIGLGLLRRGRERLGETIYACSPVTRERVAVTVTHHIFIDPEGERVRA